MRRLILTVLKINFLEFNNAVHVFNYSFVFRFAVFFTLTL